MREWIAMLSLPVVLALIGGAIWRLYWDDRDGAWHDFDGKGRMRRWVKGQWQYRDMSAEEFERHEVRQEW